LTTGSPKKPWEILETNLPAEAGTAVAPVPEAATGAVQVLVCEMLVVSTLVAHLFLAAVWSVGIVVPQSAPQRTEGTVLRPAEPPKLEVVVVTTTKLGAVEPAAT
jgi:hypothetical protein